MKIESYKYANQSVNFFGIAVKFEKGIAEVSDELGTRILESGFPNVYVEGKVPAKKSQAEIALEGSISEKDRLAQEEISRLKNIIKTHEANTMKLNEELREWKSIVEKLKAHIAPDVLNQIFGDQGAKSEEVETKAMLELRKKDEIIEIAKTLGVSDEMLMSEGKLKTKAELIDLILEASK